MQKPENKKQGDTSDVKDKNLGVLYTGYVDKKNPLTGTYHKRFLVLTQDSIHWFNRVDNNDLFGEERGHIPLGEILSVRIIDEDSTIFELKDATNNKVKYFRCNSPTNAEEWVSGIRSAIKRMSSNDRKKVTRKGNIFQNINFKFDEADLDSDEGQSVEVNVLLVSLRSVNVVCNTNGNTSGKNPVVPTCFGNEVVVARNPQWNRIILINNVTDSDELVISTSNGGTAILSASLLNDKAELYSGSEFEVALQGVTLASSLRIAIWKVAGSSIDDDDSKKGKRGYAAKIFSGILKIIGNRRNTATAVIAATFLFVGLSSFASINEDTSFMFLLALILALHSLHLLASDIFRSDKGGFNLSLKAQKQNSTRTYRVILRSHAFTSPDAPVNDPEDEIPKRFIIGCDYDMKEARRRWDITKHWRESEGVNTILQREQPHFFTIKEFYPHYHAGRGKQGNIVFYDRPGELDSAQMSARGVTVKDLIQHFIFITEYQWQILCEGDETAKSIAVLDMANVKLADLTGEPLEYLKKTVGIANAHYPERSLVIFAVNAPVWFSVIWRIVKPLVHENTQKKVRILSKSQTLSGLQEHIDISQIPEYYGGQLNFGGHDSCRFKGPEALAINEYVSKLNNKQAPRVPSQDEISPSSPDSKSTSLPSSPSPLRRASLVQPAQRISLLSDASTSHASSLSSVSDPSKSIKFPTQNKIHQSIANKPLGVNDTSRQAIQNKGVEEPRNLKNRRE